MLSRPRRNYARWRALSLSLVYLVFAAHIVHWKLTGRSLAPLELNEVMYTLELGIITAGFLFMCFLVLGTLLFGRFFCSWACHIMVLQDLCSWILGKLRLRHKPLRVRLLLWVPPLTAGYMFLWPQVLRAWHSRALPTFYLATDREGWASFITTNFWRNLPSPSIIALTFLVCGFLIVYLLGTRTFCTYVCPYGAVFGLADRLSPLRIRAMDRCRQCGTCTAACSTGIRVHEEIKQHGRVVNAACMKDLDCIAACPHEVLHLSWSRPALFKSASGGRFGHAPYDFSLAEEFLMVGVFMVVLLSFRGLYSRIPFLLSLALGVIFGYLAVVGVRLFLRADVEVAHVHLKHSARLTPAGRAWAALLVALTALVGHSAYVRYHEYNGLRQALELSPITKASDTDVLPARAHAHLIQADRWGLVRNPRVDRALLTVALRLRRFEEAERFGLRFLADFPGDHDARLRLAQGYLLQGRLDAAEREANEVLGISEMAPLMGSSLVAAHRLRADVLIRRADFSAAVHQLQAAVTLDPQAAALHAELGTVLAELGRLEEARESLLAAVELDASLEDAYYNLGVIAATLGRGAEAISFYQRALALTPENADALNNLGFAFLQMEQLDEARRHLRRAVEINPSHAGAHYNLGQLYAAAHEPRLAQQHFDRAAELDHRFLQHQD